MERRKSQGSIIVEENGGGAGSRTRVRRCSAHAATCVSGDLVFVAGLAHRRGIPALSFPFFSRPRRKALRGRKAR